ncbi:MAG: iron response transcriptional regulator IrrA [Sphingomonadales bacterium]
MDRPFTEFLEKLHTAGLRPTRQRLALVRLLFEGGRSRHVTAEVLHEEARASGFSISLATVYNALRQFTSAGLLREIVVDPGRTYFDTNVSQHHHFYYERDKKLVDIEDQELEVTHLPGSPEGTSISRVDVVIRLR